MTKPHQPLTDPQLLEYYSRELLYMSALAQEFAQQHPKIAARLGMQAGDISDPYVERLVYQFGIARTGASREPIRSVRLFRPCRKVA